MNLITWQVDVDAEMERYSTWDEAVAGHAAMVARCEAEGGP